MVEEKVCRHRNSAHCCANYSYLSGKPSGSGNYIKTYSCLDYQMSELQELTIQSNTFREWVHVFIYNIQAYTCSVPPAALVCRVDLKDIQVFFILFYVQAEEVLPVLVQIVDQVSVEAVLGDNIDRAWEEHTRLCCASASFCRLILSEARKKKKEG